MIHLNAISFRKSKNSMSMNQPQPYGMKGLTKTPFALLVEAGSKSKTCNSVVQLPNTY